MRRALPLVVLLVFTALLVSCRDDAGTPSPTPTATPTSTAASATMTPSPTFTSVRDIDLTDPAIVGPILDQFGGGELDLDRTHYADLTGDGEEDALVIVHSGGTAGDLGAALLSLEAPRPGHEDAWPVAGFIPTGGRVDVRFPDVGGGIVVTTEGVWEPGDPGCCPSRLRESTYEWEDGAFVLRDEQVIDNPDAE